MKAIKAGGLIVFLLCSTAVCAFPELTAPDEVKVAVRDITTSPASGGTMLFDATIDVYTGRDVTSDWGPTTVEIFIDGIRVALCSPGSPVPLNDGTTSGNPYPIGSLRTPWSCPGRAPRPDDPRSDPADTGRVVVCAEAVVTPSNPLVHFATHTQDTAIRAAPKRKAEELIKFGPQIHRSIIYTDEIEWISDEPLNAPPTQNTIVYEHHLRRPVTYRLE